MTLTKVVEIEPAAAALRRPRASGIDRAVQIFDHLQAIGRAATGYEIARGVGAPLSTIYALIDDLVEKKLLSRNDDNAVWLGPRLYHYGLAYARDLKIITVATHEMHVLSREIGETVQICGRDGDMMVVEAMAEGPGHFTVASRVGTRVPLNWTASGRLLVAGLNPSERIAFFRRVARTSPTGRAIVNPTKLAQQVEAALQTGFWIQEGESDYAVACVAAPVLDPEGDCPITVSIVLPESKVSADQAHFANAVRGAAARVEESLGWTRTR